MTSEDKTAANFFRFGIRRLVLVDSAGFCYVEIPLTQHALILGSGNLGKSSLLNSLRLFLLPENNFRNSRNKFAFRNASAGSFYSNEESYQHYFPSQHSFLIMEVESPAGVHCQVLYRDQSSQLSYGRIFVPVPYEQLRPLFWQCNDEDGIGERVPDLSFSKVSAGLNKLSRDTLVTSDPSKLKKLLYSSNLMSQDEVRYAVLPLADPDERKVQSLRTLILLLFEMKADDKAMASAVASIVEADKKFADDAFDMDIDQFLNRHEELKRRQLHLDKIEGLRPQFEKLQTAYRDYQALLQNQHEFADFRDGLANALGRIGEERRLADNERNDLQASLKQAQQALENLKSEKNQLEGALREQKKALARAEATQRDGTMISAEYVGFSTEEILATLKDALAENDEQLRALKSAAQAEERKKALTAAILDFDQKLKTLAKREEREQWQLHHQLDDDVIAPLRAVNQRLVNASPGRPLDSEAQQAIKTFAALFNKNEQGYTWFDAEFSAMAPEKEDFAEQRQKLKGERHAVQRQLDELNSSDESGQGRPQRIAAIEREIAAIKKNMETVGRLDAVPTQIADATQAIDEASREQAKVEERADIQNENVAAVQGKLSEARARAERLKERQTELIHLDKQVTADQRRVQYLTSIEAKKPLAIEKVSAALLDDIHQKLDQMDELRLKILNSLSRLVAQGLYEDTEGELESDSPSWHSIKKAFKALSDTFSAQIEQRQVLEKEIEAHNETVASYRQSIKSNAEHIQRFEAGLNRELEGVEINDLVEIRVDIHTDPKFHNLVEESADIDPYSHKLQSDAFYDRLRVFVAEFFGDNKSGNRLTMDKVVTGISYRTRKQSATSLDTKGQSTSTTALINLELVHRLLRRVLYPKISLSFPMVLDELASVDVSQVPSLLSRLQAQGFNLFSAATHSASPELIYQVGRHLEVGQMRTAKPYSRHRTLVFWGGPEGFSSREGLPSWVEQSQDSLLDVSYEQ